MGANTIRMYAADVAVDPTINGNDNVQDALAAPITPSGVLFTAPNGTTAASNPAVAVPADGATHAVLCALAAPPAWMDNASNIIEAGMYDISVVFTKSVAPTVPGLVISPLFGFFWFAGVSQDVVQVAAQTVHVLTVALEAGDLPFPVATQANALTDATATYTAVTIVTRLAISIS